MSGPEGGAGATEAQREGRRLSLGPTRPTRSRASPTWLPPLRPAFSFPSRRSAGAAPHLARRTHASLSTPRLLSALSLPPPPYSRAPRRAGEDSGPPFSARVGLARQFYRRRSRHRRRRPATSLRRRREGWAGEGGRGEGGRKGGKGRRPRSRGEAGRVEGSEGRRGGGRRPWRPGEGVRERGAGQGRRRAGSAEGRGGRPAGGGGGERGGGAASPSQSH